MIIGIPKEIKDHEYRVAMTPGGVVQMVGSGHRVLVERAAGEGSGFSDQDYQNAGAQIVAGAEEAWKAEMVVKVKEPLLTEYAYLRPGLVLFTYLHLAAERPLTDELMLRGVTGIAYETVELPDGQLPLLKPMSEVAGRLAVQMGAFYLVRHHGGSGKLLGGVAGVEPGRVTVIGAGVVGANAARIALGMGAEVTVLDTNIDRLRHLEEVLHERLITRGADPLSVEESVAEADLLVGAVLVKGARTPRVVSRQMVSRMSTGSVVVDVSVDQGGCVETIHPTSHSNPVYLVGGILHYGVTNMPGAVPRTSTIALSNATFPYVFKLASLGIQDAVASSPDLAKGVNTYRGDITYRAVAEAFGLPYTPLEILL
ncbi:MAG TPA: alanine dehydrogenase [Syntrophales bacterium]|nr:alanine dehydrogenase [Syntrophales bacterium]